MRGAVTAREGRQVKRRKKELAPIRRIKITVWRSLTLESSEHYSSAARDEGGAVLHNVEKRPLRTFSTEQAPCEDGERKNEERS